MPVGRAFTDAQAKEVDRALRGARDETGLRFSVWIGRSSEEGRVYVRRLHAALGPASPSAVLIAVDPIGRRLEIVTGEHARQRLDDRTCALVAMSMTSSFAIGDLVSGITHGVRMLSDHAVRTPISHQHTAD